MSEPIWPSETQARTGSERNGQKEASFWSRPFRLLQPNLRSIDARGLDVKALVRETAAYGANAILVNGGGILAWYPTSHPYQSVNAEMKGDYLGEVIAAAHAQGLKVLVRMDVSKSFPHVLERHPDWFRRDAKGEVKRHWEMLMTCPTGPYWEQYNFEVVGELLRRYPADGLFFNAFNYLQCHCERCRGLFRETTGLALPEEEDWDDPAWQAYVRYRYERFADYNRRLAAYIERIAPGTVLTIDTNLTSDTYRGIRESGWYAPQFAQGSACITSEAFNFYDRPAPRWPYWAGEETMLGSHIKHTCIILSYSKTIYSRRSAQPAAQLGYDLMQIAACGGSPAVALSGQFDQDDRQGLPIVRRLFTYLQRHEREYAELSPCAEVAILYSQRTADVYGRDDPAGRWQSHYRGMYEMLAECHLPFTVLHEGSLTAERLQRYRCLLLPNIAVLTEDEARLIDDYVAAGGHVIATHETGRYDASGRLRDTLALRCLDRRVPDEPPVACTYLQLGDARLRAALGGEIDLLMAEGGLLRTVPLSERPASHEALRTGKGLQRADRSGAPEGAGAAAPQPARPERSEALDRLEELDALDERDERDERDELHDLQDLYGIPAVRNTTPEFAYWTDTTDVPGLIRRRWGAGTSTYLPWAIDRLYHTSGVPEYRALIGHLVRSVTGTPLLRTDAPAGVQGLIGKRAAGGYLVHLLNGVGTPGKPLTETVPLGELTVEVRGEAAKARSLLHGTAYRVERSAAYSRIRVPALELFDAIVVEPAQ
ncbi:beta-galactosidase trimerization domain-containing protein [Paenibacillus sp. IB182496]|uniref:Beta-galactosidase trimerization domain-containing protein n=1 Tax=Paenibacillus sabuli TaxID=2772509 RepID=A0A927GQC1_9BACL|nr:alpha-amylase family protein [Paenibacillus sabuli]MBD2844364.1 beta-galactosidase trimerization domain-containing protein [Paenibacillus sabuli]